MSADERPGGPKPATVEFQLLGELAVWAGGHRVDIGSARQRAVLAALVVDANRAVPLDVLVERVWSADRLPDRPARTVQTYLSQLRHILPAVAITRRSGGYVLTADPERIDLHEFRRLAALAQDCPDDEKRVVLLEMALARWRGEALASLDTPWCRAVRDTLGNERYAAELDLVDTRLRLGRHAGLLASLLDRAARHPLDERVAGQVMLTLYRSGRRADALEHYRQLRRTLADELGSDPGTALQHLHQRILTDDPTLTPGGEPEPAPRRTEPVPEQLPAPPTMFTGRVGELAALDDVLPRLGRTDTVLITAIGGSAGVGKTALALRWVHRHRDRFPDGQLFVNLRGYDPDRPMPAADALARLLVGLNVPQQAIPLDLDDRATRFRTAVAGRRMVLVLDNAATTEQVGPLLPGTTSCLVLVTSRDSLGGLVALHGAYRLVLDVLPPVDAVTLLRGLIGPRVDAEPDAAMRLALRCDRLPLALRVAAERATLRPAAPLAELADELARRRLGVLDTGDDPHAAVRVVFSWSYRHLPAPARDVFRLLGLHPGPTLDRYAVAALGRLPLPPADLVVDALVRAHLLTPVDGDRLAMHDLMRAYANDLAATEDPADLRRAALTRLLDHYVAAAAAAMDVLHAAERASRPAVPAPDTPVPAPATAAAARAWLDAERPTLIDACAHAADNGWPRHAALLSIILYRYLESGHYTDALALHTHALRAARASGDRHGEATALTNLGAVARLVGRYDKAGEHLNRASALFAELGDPRGHARALSNLGVVDDRTGRPDAAAANCRRALALYRQAGDRAGEAGVLTNLGAIEDRPGRQGHAVRHLRRALTLYRRLGDDWGEAMALANLGDLIGQLGDQPAAAAHLGAALVRFRALGHRYGQASVLSGLADVLTRLGDPRTATEHHTAALALFRELGHRYGEAAALNGLGEAAAATGDIAGAVARHRAALAVAIAAGDHDQRVRAEAALGRLGGHDQGTRRRGSIS